MHRIFQFSKVAQAMADVYATIENCGLQLQDTPQGDPNAVMFHQSALKEIRADQYFEFGIDTHGSPLVEGSRERIIFFLQCRLKGELTISLFYNGLNNEWSVTGENVPVDPPLIYSLTIEEGEVPVKIIIQEDGTVKLTEKQALELASVLANQFVHQS